jgi:hypothetical protein
MYREIISEMLSKSPINHTECPYCGIKMPRVFACDDCWRKFMLVIKNNYHVLEECTTLQNLSESELIQLAMLNQLRKSE